MSRRTTLMLCVLAVLAGISYFLVNDDGDVETVTNARLPDGYYLTGATLSATDESGVVHYTLRAQRIVHRPDDRVIALTELEFDYGNAANLWRVSADNGLMPPAGNRIALSGDVTAKLQSAAAHGATQMLSPSLTIDIEGETAATDEPVTVKFENGELRAVGLDVDLANESITLRSQVQGVFEPPEQRDIQQ